MRIVKTYKHVLLIKLDLFHIICPLWSQTFCNSVELHGQHLHKHSQVTHTDMHTSWDSLKMDLWSMYIYIWFHIYKHTTTSLINFSITSFCQSMITFTFNRKFHLSSCIHVRNLYCSMRWKVCCWRTADNTTRTPSDIQRLCNSLYSTFTLS